MALDLRLQQKMAQQLVMTPQLQQAIKLLQLSHLEVADVLREELTQNPILEELGEYPDENQPRLVAAATLEPESSTLASSEVDLGAQLDGDAQRYTNADDYRGGDDFDHVPMDQSPVEASANNAAAQQDSPDNLISELSSDHLLDPTQPDKSSDFDWDVYLENYNYALPATANHSRDEDLPAWETHASAAPSLVEHLRWQLQMRPLSRSESRLALLLLDELGDDGYLPADVVQSVAQQLEIEPNSVEEALFHIQQLEPRGVGARSLQECLMLQASSLGDPCVMAILERFLSHIERRNLSAIAKELQVSLAEVTKALKVIQQLEPRPGRAFVRTEPQYITPDIYVHKVANDFVINLNEDGLPRLRISHYYQQAMQHAPQATQSYIQEKMRSATWLLRSIHMRQRTIYRVMESILKLQRDFFEHGVRALRPLILKEVAEDVGMHESTISRVTTNKYVHTPMGIYELKYFFNSAIAGSAGEHVASESVRNQIKRLIEAENQCAPYSDQKIVEILAEQQVHLARRTVAKYREKLRIPSSSQRKRVF